jgi:hypothetical protein
MEEILLSQKFQVDAYYQSATLSLYPEGIQITEQFKVWCWGKDSSNGS